ncbi:hypothetical protein Dvina_16805 [Dactylosporangium vinaceum]|uniref:Uncharacterized protein n=1 Tax=Dactylosporangium vinaceum TaxID=53362 RepID=A0ABV5M1D5_9ACTN|nr:hypothetical protein [Dactylosporangium vinaceum]UAB99579.1 hypothetical protein Dvina_16805 [Dactylosporangium vinaceum]
MIRETEPSGAALPARTEPFCLPTPHRVRIVVVACGDKIAPCRGPGDVQAAIEHSGVSGGVRVVPAAIDGRPVTAYQTEGTMAAAHRIQAIDGVVSVMLAAPCRMT